MRWRKSKNQRFILFTNLYAIQWIKLKKTADDYTKSFSQQLPTSREQMNFIKNKINSNSQIEKIDKWREGNHFVEDDRKIANTLNNCFARFGLYKGKNVSPNHSSLTFEGPE